MRHLFRCRPHAVALALLSLGAALPAAAFTATSRDSSITVASNALKPTSDCVVGTPFNLAIGSSALSSAADLASGSALCHQDMFGRDVTASYGVAQDVSFEPGLIAARLAQTTTVDVRSAGNPASNAFALDAGNGFKSAFTLSDTTPLLLTLQYTGSSAGVQPDSVSFTITGFTSTGLPTYLWNMALQAVPADTAFSTLLALDPQYSYLIDAAARAIAGPGTDTTTSVLSFSLGLVSAVPEPSSWAMLALGLLGVGAVSHRRRATD